MKKVFSSNSQLSHVWANQLQSEGRGNSMFFEGPVIYSYGYHYEIARFVDAPNGQKVVFFNDNSYSNSTAKHSRHVRHAIPDGIPVFTVPFQRSGGFYYRNYQSFNIDSLPGIIDAILLECKNLCFDQTKARSKYYLFNEAAGKYAKIVQICELFDIPVPARPDNWDEARIKAEYLRSTQGERDAKKEARELARKQKAAEKEAELLAKWLSHEYNGQLYNVPVHLRISTDGRLIETTKGARVPMTEAVKLLQKLRNSEDVKGYKIDGFTVIENTDEAVKIGCHTISWPVINQFFK